MVFQIDAASLQELRSLKTLDLSYNELRDLRSECFAEIKKLQYLDLSYNEVRNGFGSEQERKRERVKKKKQRERERWRRGMNLKTWCFDSR